jgi:hypothetical protein
VVATCRRLGLDLFVYIRVVFTQLPLTPVGRIHDLLADRWVEASRRIA